MYEICNEFRGKKQVKSENLISGANPVYLLGFYNFYQLKFLAS